MIDRITQLFTAIMDMPLEGQILVGTGALVSVVAIKSIWKFTFPIRWTIGSALRLTAFVVHPRKRKASNVSNGSNVNMNNAPEFDLSTKEKAERTYTYYAGTSMRETLSPEQMALLSAAVTHYDIKGNGGLTAELERRGMPENNTSTGGNSQIPAFDFSTKEKAQAAYDYYAGTDAAQMLSHEQLAIISEAIELFDLKRNSGLTREKDRRKMQKKVAELQNRTTKMQEELVG